MVRQMEYSIREIERQLDREIMEAQSLREA